MRLWRLAPAPSRRQHREDALTARQVLQIASAGISLAGVNRQLLARIARRPNLPLACGQEGVPFFESP